MVYLMSERRYNMLKQEIKAKELREDQTGVRADYGKGYIYGLILYYINASLNLPEGTITKITVY